MGALKTLSSLASALSPGIGQSRTRATLIELDQKTDAQTSDKFSFQYFPETISDSMGAEYSSGAVAGGSLPIGAYKRGTDRVITFTAQFSCDMNLLMKTDPQDPGFVNLSAQVFDQLRDIKEDHRNVDIRAAVVWLRRFLLPTYKKGGSDVGQGLTQAPRKLLLYLPNSGIGIAGGDDDLRGALSPDMVLCYLTQCDVEYQAFFPSGLPRLASVQLSFTQCPQHGGAVFFPAATGKMDDVVRDGAPYGDFKIYPYTVKMQRSLGLPCWTHGTPPDRHAAGSPASRRGDPHDDRGSPVPRDTSSALPEDSGCGERARANGGAMAGGRDKLAYEEPCHSLKVGHLARPQAYEASGYGSRGPRTRPTTTTRSSSRKSRTPTR